MLKYPFDLINAMLQSTFKTLWFLISFVFFYPLSLSKNFRNFCLRNDCKSFLRNVFIWLTQPSIGPLFNFLLSYSLKNLIGKDKLYRCFLKSCKIFGFGRRRKTKPFHLVSGWELLSLTFQDIERIFSCLSLKSEVLSWIDKQGL